jgi:RNA polymerase sigma-70 factor (ECF subfamily)
VSHEQSVAENAWFIKFSYFELNFLDVCHQEGVAEVSRGGWRTLDFRWDRRRCDVSAIQTPLSQAAPASASDLIDLYWDRAYRFAAMVTRNDLESADIAQEALLKALRHLNTFDPEQGTFESWLWQIVLNAARDAGRAAGRRQALLDRLKLHGRVTAEGDAEALALRRLDDDHLLSAVRRLPKQPRTVIALRFGAGLSYREMGRQLGVSEAAAVMATRRALATLRRYITSKESPA